MTISKIFIIAVPTPIDKHKRPDLTLLEKSSQLVGSVLKKNDIQLRKDDFVLEIIGDGPLSLFL